MEFFLIRNGGAWELARDTEGETETVLSKRKKPLSFRNISSAFRYLERHHEGRFSMSFDGVGESGKRFFGQIVGNVDIGDGGLDVSANPLKIKEREDVVVFVLKGSLDGSTIDGAEKVVRANRGYPKAVFRLEELEYISSVGIRLLIECHLRIFAKVCLVCPKGDVEKALMFSGITSRITTVPTYNDALRVM